MAYANIAITTESGVTELVIDNLNFEESRTSAALRIGESVVDAIYNSVEG